MDIKAKERYLDAVKEESALFQRLMDVLGKEKGILVRNSTAAMEVLLREKEEIIGVIALKEGFKRAALVDMAKSLDLADPGKLTLTDILVAAPLNSTLEIETAVEGLVKLLEKISGANAGNRRMVSNFLKFSGFSRELREKITSPKMTYSVDGEKRFEKNGGKNLDFKI